MDEGELLRTIFHNIVGIDLNPLAVIVARTNYLLALRPLLKHRGKEPSEIPVYLADSIMTPPRGADNLFEAEKVRVWLWIGKVELPLRLATQDGVTTLKISPLLASVTSRARNTPSVCGGVIRQPPVVPFPDSGRTRWQARSGAAFCTVLGTAPGWQIEA